MVIVNKAACLIVSLVKMEEDSFSREQSLLRIPGKQDGHVELNWLAIGRWHIKPLILVRARNVCLFKNTLWADHNILQIEMNIGEGTQQMLVKGCCSFLPIPGMTVMSDD